MMDRKKTFFLASLLVTACTASVSEQAPAGAVTPTTAPTPAAGGARTVWDGVYTAAQADRGEAIAQASCISCHAARTWINPNMMRLWNRRPVYDLFDQIRTTMPYDTPGSLSDQQYVDIVSYILALNEVPAGAVELPADDAALSLVQFVPRP